MERLHSLLKLESKQKKNVELRWENVEIREIELQL